MVLYEVAVTAVIDATDTADAEKKTAAIEKLLPGVKIILASKGVKSITIGKPRVKS